MARDAKLAFTFTQTASPSVTTGGLRINNLAGTGTTASAFVYADAAGGAYDFLRGASNALNVGGFRNTLADASVLVTQAGGSAISGDPALVGVTVAPEIYLRMVFASAGVAVAANTKTFVCVEAASDSGTGSAGTDWTSISPLLDVSSSGAVRSLSFVTTAATGGQFTTGSGSTPAAHGLAVGDIVVFTAAGTGTGATLQQPYYVATVPTSSTFTLTSSVNGAPITTFALTTAPTATATPAQKRLIGLPISPTAKPWYRVAVQIVSTGGTAAATQGVYIQDAFISLGRDGAALS